MEKNYLIIGIHILHSIKGECNKGKVYHIEDYNEQNLSPIYVQVLWRKWK